MSTVVRILAGAFLGTIVGQKVAELAGLPVLGLVVGIAVWTICVTFGTTTFIELPDGPSTEVEVEVVANCDASSGGSWEYFLGCPE